MRKFNGAGFVCVLALVLSGCASMSRKQPCDEFQKQIADLERTVKDLQSEKESKLSDLERAKQELEKRLQKEIEQYKANLEMTEQGLVVTFLAEVFFNSGKAEVLSQAEDSLRKVAGVLNKDVAGYLVAVAGHTDNEPIKYSTWKSNWELSSARALAVLHFFIEECAMAPERLSATAYGEYKPRSGNDTLEGRQRNRRVEIVVFPANEKTAQTPHAIRPVNPQQ